MKLIDLVKLTISSDEVNPPEEMDLNNWKSCPSNPKQVYECFRDLLIDDVNVVIVGQDPYPIPGIATGLAFGVEPNERLQPSLEIIYNELIFNYSEDITLGTDPSDTKMYFDKTLQHWKKQGVLLMNAALTCKEYCPEGENMLNTVGSHSYYWKKVLMENLFINLNEALREKTVFVFMGKKAQYYSKFITNCPVINVIHPVADYRTGVNKFQGSGIFKEINEQLKKLDKNPIKFLVNEK